MSSKTQETKCGAPTVAGLPCTRNIDLNGNGSCWQHAATDTRTPSRRAPPRRRSSPVRRRRTSLDSLNDEYERMNVRDIDTVANASDLQPLIPSIEKVEIQIIVTPSKENARQNSNSDDVVIRREVESKTRHARAKSCEAEIESMEPIAQRNEPARISTSAAAAALDPPSPTPRGRRKSQGRSSDSENRQLENCIPPGLAFITRGNLVKELDDQFRKNKPGLPGHIYVCEVVPFNTPPDPDSEMMIVKIGSSGNVHSRVGRHYGKCGNYTLLRCFPYSRRFSKATVDGNRKVYHCKRVESLVQSQLHTKKLKEVCTCGTTHKETFSINIHELDEVFKCVEWWVRWSEVTFGQWDVE